MIRRIIDAGQPIPRGYGLAYWKYETRQAVLYPFPLNYVVGYLRDWWCVRRHRRGLNYVSLKDARAMATKAYQDGYAEGKRQSKWKMQPSAS